MFCLFFFILMFFFVVLEIFYFLNVSTEVLEVSGRSSEIETLAKVDGRKTKSIKIASATTAGQGVVPGRLSLNVNEFGGRPIYLSISAGFYTDNGTLVMGRHSKILKFSLNSKKSVFISNQI